MLAPILLAALCAPSDPDDGWRVRITPYLWAPSIDGSVKIEDDGGDVEEEGGSALEYLTGAAMVTFEASRGDWSLIGDVIWAEFGLEGTLDDASSTPFEADNDELVLDFAVARRIARGERAWLDAFAGLRYLHVDLRIDPQGPGPVDLSARTDLLDPFLGVRGRVGEETGLFGLAYGDVGGFGVSSDLTWQVLAGAGWAWSWGDVRVGWRELGYDFDSDGLVYDLIAGGGFLGVTFEF